MEKDQIVPSFKVLMIGGSAGSLDVLMQLLPRLPKISKMAIVIVVHRKSGEDTTLEELIALKTIIPVITVEDKTLLQPGNIFIAPSDYHLLFENNGMLALDTSEKVNHSRPSIDVSFESAADVYKNAIIAIILSGANNDGTAGLISIKQANGITIAQNPETAEMPYMPEYAIATANPDYIFTVEEILQFIITADQ